MDEFYLKRLKKMYEEFLESTSAMEVELQIGYRQGNISSCCNGERKTANGFRWRYAQEAQ